MARRRLPTEVSKAKGADLKNPGRYRGRANPSVAPLGPPPNHLNELQRATWLKFESEMPWLAKSDRVIVELAARLRARMKTSPDMGVTALNLLRLCLSSMGATPADRSKISAPDEEDDDPAARFFN